MRNERGCSLIEVLIASTILAIGVVSLAQLFTVAVASNLGATHRTHAVMLAAQKLEELRSLDFGAELRDGTADHVGEYTRRWSVTPLPANPDATLIVDVLVTWNESIVASLATMKAKRAQ
jgi:prepilin-type N-terminal cleavage/methylation domain-containing protein